MQTDENPFYQLQIKEQTQDCLTLQASRIGMAITLIGSGTFAFLLGLAFLSFGTLTILKCVREASSSQLQQNTCQIIESRIFGSRARTVIPVDQLQKAVIDHQAGKIVLLTHTDQIFFASPINGRKLSSHESRTLDQINAFIHNPQSATLVAQHDGRDPFYLLGGMIMSGGIVGFIGAMTLKIQKILIFDKKKGQMLLTNRTIFGNNSLTCNLRDIISVKIQEKLDMVYGQRLLAYEIVLVMKIGENILIEEYPISCEKYSLILAKSIRQFLNLND